MEPFGTTERRRRSTESAGLTRDRVFAPQMNRSTLERRRTTLPKSERSVRRRWQSISGSPAFHPAHLFPFFFFSSPASNRYDSNASASDSSEEGEDSEDDSAKKKKAKKVKVVKEKKERKPRKEVTNESV